MKASLVVTRGLNQGREIPITSTPFTIGRDPSCTLRPKSANISRRHCMLLIDNERVFVRDFGSTNGTLVNDRRVIDTVELHDADRLQVDRLFFEVRLEAVETQVISAAATTEVFSAPPKKPDSRDDDAIAALLLELNAPATPSALGEAGEPARPEDSTVLNMPAIDPEGSAVQLGREKKSEGQGSSTSIVAKAILAKYKKSRKPTS
jgi:predicted component of type VI protein secretion system